VRLWLLAAGWLMLPGCMLTSKVLDLNYHREASIAGKEVWIQQAILKHEVWVGMTLDEARLALEVGTTWYRYGNHWIVGNHSILTLRGGKIVRIDKYGYR